MLLALPERPGISRQLSDCGIGQAVEMFPAHSRPFNAKAIRGTGLAPSMDHGHIRPDALYLLLVTCLPEPNHSKESGRLQSPLDNSHKSFHKRSRLCVLRLGVDLATSHSDSVELCPSEG